MALHDHCRSCISRYCQFAVVEDVSCSMVFCENDCGSKFHQCKQDDHNERCLSKVVDCINKQYGCPRRFRRGKLGTHLEVCPANVVICTMEWNRWHQRYLLSKFDCKDEVEKMSGMRTVSKNLDIACSIHDQNVLLENLFPIPALKYYSDLADGIVRPYFGTETTQKNASGVSPKQEIPSSAQNLKKSCQHEDCFQGTKSHDPNVLSITGYLLRYVDEIKTAQSLNLSRGKKPRQKETKQNQKRFGISFKSSGSKKMEQPHGKKDSYSLHFQMVSPSFMSLVDALDADACDVIVTVDGLVKQVSCNTPHESKSLHGKCEKDDNINSKTKSHSLQQSSEVSSQSTAISQNVSAETSASRNGGSRKKFRWKSWLHKSGVSTEGFLSMPWQWMRRKQLENTSTSTDDLPYDRSSFDWLSPEAFISRKDIIFRLFSVAGATVRDGYYFVEKQNLFQVESSSQTVDPLLQMSNTSGIGNALNSASLSSSTIDSEEKQQTTLLKTSESSLQDVNTAAAAISYNLRYNNLALSNVLEFSPRYQKKPPTMYSFMCGCLLRRDQFSSHIQNIHCDIMSGLDGWIEQKCPYAAYGCSYSESRYCPNRSSDRVIYDQDEGAFVVSPRNWINQEEGKSQSHLSFINLPYEVHERVLHFLDGYALRQISSTCSYFRNICENYLVSKGVVETKWMKRCYDNGTTSWKIAKRVRFFPPAISKINRWTLSDSPSMVKHVSECRVAANCDKSTREEGFKVLPK